MILVADSGSTKCDWAIVGADGTIINLVKTMGFNPYFHREDIIVEEILKEYHLASNADRFTHVFFYGAGCSSEQLNSVVELALKKVFPRAEVAVEHDLLAAAYASYNGSAAISCILGTGSNSCFFDGTNFREEVPALAYILGDEGSGSFFGKKLLAAYLYKQLPNDIAQAFEKRYGLTKDEIIESVYHKEHANVYLASFMKFISDHKEDPYFQKIVYSGLKEFLRTHVCCYPEHKEVDVHFVGSIAYYFEPALRQAADELGVSIGRIIKKPIESLVAYHFSDGVSLIRDLTISDS